MTRRFTLACAASIISSLIISSANAETPKITIGGLSHWQGGASGQENGFDDNQRSYGFRSDNEIHVNVEADSDMGWKYGATIELEADVTADARDEGLNADKTFIWAETGWGRVELGNNMGPEQNMVVNAASIAKATGGIDGDDEFYINSRGITGDATFLIHPDLPTAGIGGIAEDASKITYYSPRFSGAQLGFSYTPDNGDGGQIATRNDTNGDFENVVSAGLHYERDFDGLAFATALVGEVGESELNANNDLAAWQLGAQLGFGGGFSVAGSYGDSDDSGLAKSTREDINFWTLGGAYDWSDSSGVSATYLDSDFAGNDYNSLVLGAEYSLAPGLTPYAEVSFFEANQAGTTRDNEGQVLLLGTYLNF